MLRARNDPATVLGDREVWSEEPGSQELRSEEVASKFFDSAPEGGAGGTGRRF